MASIKVRQSHLQKMLQIYQNHLSSFLYKPMTPHMIHTMEVSIRQLQHTNWHQDNRNPAWLIPVKILITSPGTFELDLDMTDVEIVG